MQVLYTQKVLSGVIIQEWSDKAEQTLKEASQGEDLQDDIFQHIKPEQREKYVKDVS